MFFYRQEVRQDLRRMIDVRQTVPYRYAGVLCKILDHLLLVAAILDTVKKSAQDLCRILDALLLAHLRTLRVQIRYVSAFIVTCHLEGTPGPRRCLVKQKNDIFSLQHFPLDAAPFLRLQVMSQIQHVADLLRGKIHQCQKASAF